MIKIKQLAVLAASALLCIGAAQASSHKAAPDMAASGAKPTAQQSKMGDCNKEAGDKKGDERKAFMKSCLSAKKPGTQQDKMKACNKDAGEKQLKGDERKKFMSECLKG